MLPPVFLRSAIRTNFASEAALSANACRPTASLFARAAVFSCTPHPSFPPHLRLYPYSVFVLFSRVEPRPLISRVCAARRSHLHQYSVFVSPFHFRPRPFGSAFVIFCFLVFPFFLDPYFRRFYDLFLRRKYLESLVRVIRRFGVHMCATKAKKFSGLTFSPAGL